MNWLRAFLTAFASAWRAAQGEGRLTRRQRQVAILAEMGFSNKEIAGQLDVTLDTVKLHLNAVYRKLGIRGRSQLKKRMFADEEPGRDEN